MARKKQTKLRKNTLRLKSLGWKPKKINLDWLTKHTY